MLFIMLSLRFNEVGLLKPVQIEDSVHSNKKK